MNNDISLQILSNYPRLLIRLAVGLFIGGGSLWWAWHGLDWPLVQQALGQISPAWIVLSTLGVIAVTLTKAARWRTLYGLAEPRMSFWKMFSVLVTAQMINLALPIRLGELIRISLMKRYGCRTTITLTTIIIEKFVDLVATGIIAVSLASLALVPVWLHESATGFFSIGLTLSAGLVLIWRLRKSIRQGLEWVLGSGRLWPERWSNQLLSSIQLTLETLNTLSQWRSLAGVMAWTIAIWLLSLLAVLALFAAFGLELPLVAAVVLMLAISVSNIAPTPPALVGVMHGIAVVVLGQYGVTQSVAFGFGLVLNLVMVAPLIILGSLTLCFHLIPLFNGLRRHGLNQPLGG
jgi:uncharacterized protein (TIRG00374 family)